LSYIVAITLFTYSCRPEGEVVREDKDSFTIADQRKIGNELARYVMENPVAYPLYRPERNTELYSRLNELLSTVVITPNAVNRSKFDWEIYVLRDDEKKTVFTMPGGKIYITSEFLKFINSEEELLAVLSHELYYADQEIAMWLLERDFSGLTLGDIIYNNPVSEKGEMIATLRETPFSHEQVEAADLYAIELLCDFVFRADGIATILDGISDENFPLDWLDTRPSYDADRANFIRKYAVTCKGGPEDEIIRYKDLVTRHLD